MTKWLEGIVTLMMIAFGTLGYLAAQKIGGFSFDPLGSKALPEGSSVLLIAVSLIVLALCLFTPLSESQEEQAEALQHSSFVQVAATLALTVAYVLSVFVFRLPISLTTALFIKLTAAILAPTCRARCARYAFITGLILGFGIEWIFTSFFFVDLPTLW